MYLHKTATISKYVQFLIYKLNESVENDLQTTNLEQKRYKKKDTIYQKLKLITATCVMKRARKVSNVHGEVHFKQKQRLTIVFTRNTLPHRKQPYKGAE